AIGMALVLVLAVNGLDSPAFARHHAHRHHHCVRFNKTTGAVTGIVGGGLLGKAVLGGPAGMLVGAAAGGIAGHGLAKNRRKHC
ncbi:MAG: hypothetical protein KGL21_09485, partial [Alphaproteobacteria bacterium]|nr:hypothetical protein [Alphaproteobacteria bacterium]